MSRRRWRTSALVGVAVLALAAVSGLGSATAAQITSVFVNNDAAHPVPVHEEAMLIPVGEGVTIAEGSDFESPFVDTSGCSEIQVLVEAHPGNGGADVATLRTSTDGIHLASWPSTYSDASPGQTLETFFFYHPTHVSVSDAPTEPVVAPKAAVHLNDETAASDRIDRAYINCLP